MKVLITGANGFIGRHLVEHFSASHELFALVRNHHQNFRAGVSEIIADLARPLDRMSLPPRVDVVIHLAQANVVFPDAADELFAVNTGATEQLLNYARLAGAKVFLLASSGDVYGSRIGLCKETDVLAPADFYGATKYASELLANAFREYFPACILRLFKPYGPQQVNRLIPHLAERICNREVIRLNKDEHPHMTPIYIDDVVTAFERTIKAPFANAINIAGDELVSFRALADAIGEVVGVQPIFEPTNHRTGDMMGDNRLMKEKLGSWPLVGLAEGLQRTLGRQRKTESTTASRFRADQII
jgi:UDP-glucose 4-epimerase